MLNSNTATVEASKWGFSVGRTRLVSELTERLSKRWTDLQLKVFYTAH